MVLEHNRHLLGIIFFEHTSGSTERWLTKKWMASDLIIPFVHELGTTVKSSQEFNFFLINEVYSYSSPTNRYGLLETPFMGAEHDSTLDQKKQSYTGLFMDGSLTLEQVASSSPDKELRNKITRIINGLKHFNLVSYDISLSPSELFLAEDKNLNDILENDLVYVEYHFNYSGDMEKKVMYDVDNGFKGKIYLRRTYYANKAESTLGFLFEKGKSYELGDFLSIEAKPLMIRVLDLSRFSIRFLHR